jgi:hypothetical protein
MSAWRGRRLAWQPLEPGGELRRENRLEIDEAESFGGCAPSREKRAASSSPFPFAPMLPNMQQNCLILRNL